MSAVSATFVATLMVAICTGCGGGICRDDPLMAQNSPDGRYTAVVSKDVCLLERGSGTRVTVTGNAGWNSDDHEVIVTVHEELPGWVRWEGNQRLVVLGLSTGTQSFKLTRYRDIEILYEN